MLILLEGVDKVGKSTVAAQLAEALGDGVEVRHCVQPEEHALAEYELPLADYVPGSGRHVIYDRHFLGEAIYGPFYREHSILDPISRAHIEAFLTSRGAVLVRLSADKNVLQRRHREEREDFLRYEDITRFQLRYREEFEASNVGVTYVGESTDKELVGTLISLARAAEKHAMDFASTPTYVGSPVPSVLLLGERRGGTDRRYPAAFVPLPTTSGLYLHQSLLAAGTYLGNVGLANAVEDEANLHDLWAWLEKPPVVSLGNEAHDACLRQQVPHGAVPHPQWVRRFHHDQRFWYGRLISRAWHRQLDLRSVRP